MLQNLKEVLELAGSSLEQVVKYNVYLAEMKDFAAMNEAYIAFLPNPMPSRSCLQAVPPGDGTVIEIECIAQAKPIEQHLGVCANKLDSPNIKSTLKHFFEI